MGSMDLMNGQSSSVNIAATASEVRIIKLWILNIINANFLIYSPKSNFLFRQVWHGKLLMCWFDIPQFRCE